MRVLSYVWLAVLLILLVLFVTQYKDMSTQDRWVLILAMAISGFMYGFRRKSR